MACGFRVSQVLERGGQARIHARQRLAVGLVLAVFVAVGGVVCQRLHLGRAFRQHGGDGQFAAQVVHFGQVVAQRDFGLAAQGVFQGLGTDVGVAIAVATDPLAHAQKAVHRVVAQLFFQIGVEFGNLAQERGFVVAQRILDFVGHREFGKTQQAGLPQLHDAGPHMALVGGQLPWR